MVPYMNKKRTELGAWGRLSKRDPGSSPTSQETHPLIRIIKRGGRDSNQWNRRVIKRGKDLNQWERKRMSGKNLIKWDRMRETNADEEDEECEQNEEEYTDEAEKLQQELIDGQEDDDSADLIFFRLCCIVC